MLVSELMTRDVRLAAPNDTIERAATMMGEVDAGAIPVGENDRLVGMITDRDIAVRAVAQGKSPMTTVREVMSSNVKYCFEDEAIEDVARRFAKEGYAALALDLLSREGGTAGMDRDAVPGALTQAGAQRHVADFAAALEYLRAQDFVDGGRIAMTGYCFGGGITWQAAAELDGLKATAAFYGPAPDLAKVPDIKAAVFGVYAELDQRITGPMPELKDALAAAGVVHQLTVYPGVDHAFHNDTGDRYNEAQATAAWNDTLAWFNQHL